MNITCKFEQNILKIDLLIAFLLKKLQTVRFSLRTLYSIFTSKFFNTVKFEKCFFRAESHQTQGSLGMPWFVPWSHHTSAGGS
jgi:hypothetical protein